ncbi:glycosyltransferase, partial [Candidatus Woesebacteria bacterium]|nr:glycosyltransferase [Candidatus Woesebacteria bacterium]
GTPSIVYNVDGLRDSVQNGKAGYLCLHNNPDELAKAIYELFSNENMYKDLQKKAWEFSKQYTYQRSYQDYIKAIEYVS